MGRILVIGAAGLIGAEVVKALGAENCIRASRSSDEKVDISDPRSLEALFGRIGELDGVICAGGAARFKPWDQLTDEDWTFSLANKLLGQINVVRYGAKKRPRRRRDHADDRARVAISRSRQRDHHNGQFRGRRLRARLRGGARDQSPRQRRFSRLGRRNPEGAGSRSGGGHPRRRRRRDYSPAVSPGRIRLGRARPQKLKRTRCAVPAASALFAAKDARRRNGAFACLRFRCGETDPKDARNPFPRRRVPFARGGGVAHVHHLSCDRLRRDAGP